MNLTEAFFIVYIVTIAGGFFVAWKALDDASDFINFLVKVTDVFTSSLTVLAPSQRFNVLIDIILALGVGFMTLFLESTSKDVFHSIEIFVGSVLFCLLISVIVR